MAAFSRPTKEQLGTLTFMERAAFEVGDFSSRWCVVPAKAWNTVFMGFMLWATSSRRLHVHGLPNLAKFGSKDRVLVACNHRSFFDFFVISRIVFFQTKLSHRILFPVRSSFFYDHPLGPIVNATMSGMRMFPPVMRGDSVRRRATFNEYSVQRSIEELSVPGTVMGLHPEGTRNKNDDPYKLLRARAGVGRIALGAPDAHVIPAFVLGISNNLPREFAANAFRPEETRIDCFIGPEVRLDDLRMLPATPSIAQRASERMLDAVRALGHEHRRQFGDATAASAELADAAREVD